LRPVGRPRKYESDDVARVVVEARAAGSAVTRAVAEHFGVKPSYASALIARAKKEGLL
jgi:transposase